MQQFHLINLALSFLGIEKFGMTSLLKLPLGPCKPSQMSFPVSLNFTENNVLVQIGLHCQEPHQWKVLSEVSGQICSQFPLHLIFHKLTRSKTLRCNDL